MKKLSVLIMVAILALSFGNIAQAKPFPSLSKIEVASYWVGNTGKVVLTGKLCDANGEVLANKTVKFFVGGYFQGSVITDKNGKGQLPIAKKGRAYQVKVVFEGDGDYYESFNYMELINPN